MMADSIFPDESKTSLARGSFPGGTSWSAEASRLLSRDVLFPLFGPSDPLYPRDEPEAIVHPYEVMELVRQGQWYSALTSLVPALSPAFLRLPALGRVLDLACGVGDLLMHLCAMHPTCKVVGMDVNPDLLRYVCARAKGEGRDNLLLVEHNIRDPIPSELIPFHWISARFLGSLLSRGEYLALLSRLKGHLFAGGRVHLVECHEGYSSSALCGQLRSLYLDAVSRFGFFEPEYLEETSSAGSKSLEVLLTDAGYTQVSSQQFYLPLSHPLCLNYLRVTAHQLISFLRRAGPLAEQESRRFAAHIEEELGSLPLRGYFLIESASGSCPIPHHHTDSPAESDHQGERQELRE